MAQVLGSLGRLLHANSGPSPLRSRQAASAAIRPARIATAMSASVSVKPCSSRNLVGIDRLRGRADNDGREVELRLIMFRRREVRLPLGPSDVFGGDRLERQGPARMACSASAGVIPAWRRAAIVEASTRTMSPALALRAH